MFSNVTLLVGLDDTKSCPEHALSRNFAIGAVLTVAGIILGLFLPSILWATLPASYQWLFALLYCFFAEMVPLISAHKFLTASLFLNDYSAAAGGNAMTAGSFRSSSSNRLRPASGSVFASSSSPPATGGGVDAKTGQQQTVVDVRTSLLTPAEKLQADGGGGGTGGDSAAAAAVLAAVGGGVGETEEETEGVAEEDDAVDEDAIETPPLGVSTAEEARYLFKWIIICSMCVYMESGAVAALLDELTLGTVRCGAVRAVQCGAVR